ncbi:MAG: glycosyltransferase family 4 protein [Caldilinea sp.]|nr:glycosyltransferase family 4 protein [Caldilinea sp.]MDW8438868.1 glycosyltransferase family 1 protein [Caldilineaceae bacterium]
MRIGVDTRLMHYQPAGISRYTGHLLQALAELNKEDEFIIFQHPKHRSPLIQQANFRRAALFAPVHHRFEQIFLAAELLRFRLDLIHSTDFIPPLYSPVAAVITVHDLAFLHYPHFLTAKSAAYYGQIDKAVVKAAHIIVPSEYTRQDLIAQLGVPAHKVTVIHEAANPIFKPLPYQETLAAVQKRHGLSERFVLCVGTIEPRKNINGLLQAFAHLRNKYRQNEVMLAIAGGKGWLYDETIEMVKTLNLQPWVRFLGRVSDDELHQLYVAARCHVHPAYYEGFGLPPLEAMACGTPTIVSNVSSLPEVVGDAALLVNPLDVEEIAVAMQRLLTDDDLHAELRQKGLRRARIFSWERAARRTLDVYRQVAEPHRAASQQPAATTPEKGL